MFEKVSQMAEQAATRASRRQFLDRIGRGAIVVAAAAAGLLAVPGEAEAARGSRRCPPRCYRVKGNCICPQ